MDGIETLHRMKEDFAGTPDRIEPVYIALTANAVSGAKEMYLAEGFMDYISKPVEGKILEEKLKTYLGCHEDKIVTINNGVDVEKIHTAHPIDDLKTDKFVIVMVAGFREAKDQDTVIRAMALLPKEQFELWLVGDGVRRRNLELTIDNLQMKDRVRLLGLRTDVPNILKTADVVVMSSHWEGLSLSNIEGMSAGKPFVASDVNGLREVTQGYGLLFPHGDDEALAKIILRLSQDKNYYQENASRCYERAKEYDIQKTVEGYFRVYEELIS